VASFDTPKLAGRPEPALTAGPAFAKGPGMRKGVYIWMLVLGLLVATCRVSPAKSLDDLLFYAVESLARGRDQLAVDALGEALAADPDNPYALARLGLARAELGQTGPARQVLEQALAVNGDNLSALWTLGCLDLTAGHPQQATARFAAMGQADPGNAQAALGQGLALAMAGRVREAVWFLSAAQAADSQDAQTRYLTGLAYWLLDAPANARLELETALELAPRYTPALDLLGLVYRRLGKAGLSKSAWEQALAVSDKDARARYFLSREAQDAGLAAVLDDHKDEARRAYLEALQIDRTNAAAAVALTVLGPPARPKAGP
jgi:tetratricopeptide (TPR) repeat protein